mgnify:CR=1 FL=1
MTLDVYKYINIPFLKKLQLQLNAIKLRIKIYLLKLMKREK